MRLAIGLPLTDDKEYSRFWDSFTIMEKPDFVYCRPEFSCSAVDKVRNELVKQAIKDNCSHLLLMDTDQIYRDRQTVVKMVESRDKAEVIGTVVYRRYEPFDPLVYRMGDSGFERVSDEELESGKIIEADAIGCGCVLYNVDIFRKIESPWFEDLTHIINVKGEQGPGEDIGICYKLKREGFRILVDTSILIDHLTLFAVNHSFYKLYKRLTGAVLERQRESSVLKGEE